MVKRHEFSTLVRLRRRASGRLAALIVAIRAENRAYFFGLAAEFEIILAAAAGEAGASRCVHSQAEPGNEFRARVPSRVRVPERRPYSFPAKIPAAYQMPFAPRFMS